MNYLFLNKIILTLNTNIVSSTKQAQAIHGNLTRGQRLHEQCAIRRHSWEDAR